MFSLASLHPFSAFCFFAGGRAVTRFYQAALFVGDERAAKAAMSEIEVFRSVFLFITPTPSSPTSLTILRSPPQLS